MTPIETTINYRIALLCRASRNYMTQRLAQFGLYIGQEFILVQLWKEENITQSALAERVGVDLSTITKSLQRLEGYGVVVRHPDPDDARQMRVCLTDHGRELEALLTDVWNDAEAYAMRDLSADEQAQLAHLLARIQYKNP